MSTTFKTFTAVLTPSERDYGLELAVRRRMTKSLQGEDQLRRKLIASLYGERNTSIHNMFSALPNPSVKTTTETPANSVEDMGLTLRLQSVTSNRTMSDIGTYEDWFGNEVVLPRDTDRILEQFGLMLLRIAAFLEKDDIDPVKLFNTSSQTMLNNPDMLKCTAVANDDTDTPPHVGSSKGRVASYLIEYPQIFMKKTSDICRPPNSEHELIHVRNAHTTTRVQTDEHNDVNKTEKETFVSYEVTRKIKTMELDFRDSKLMPNVLNSKGSNNNTKKTQYYKNKNIGEKNIKSKAVNTACRLKTLDKVLCTDKISQSTESKSARNKTKSHITDKKSSQKTEKGKPYPSSSENSTSSNC